MERTWPQQNAPAPSRRSFLVGALAAAAGAIGPGVARGTADVLSGVKVLTFDMQGTVFDFYTPMIGVAEAIGRKRGLRDGWAATLPSDWSGAAHDIIVDISAGRRPWMSNTQVYRETLPKLLGRLGADATITSSDRDELLAVWARMKPWPDALQGLAMLRRRFTLSTLTNAAMSQMTALVKDNNLPFDEILTGELAQAFKPDPRVYQLAVAYTGARPEEILMVSAHKWDLEASKRSGFRTAYVPRPFELGPGHAADLTPERYIDVAARDLVDLANRLT